MKAHPFIVVDRLKEEIEYYRTVLGGEIEILRKMGDAVWNADLLVDETVLKFADAQASLPVRQGDYVRPFLKLDTEEQIRRVYSRFAEGGTIVREIYEAPFDGLLAVVTDRNGVCWVLSYYRD